VQNEILTVSYIGGIIKRQKIADKGYIWFAGFAYGEREISRLLWLLRP
jgi:hypothetical protein